MTRPDERVPHHLAKLSPAVRDEIVRAAAEVAATFPPRTADQLVVLRATIGRVMLERLRQPGDVP